MAELSALGVKITSDGVVKTTGELERFAKAATAASKAAKPISVKVGVAGVSKAAADIQKMDAAMKSMGGGSAGAAIKSTSAAIANTGNAARQASAHVQSYRNAMAAATAETWEKQMATRAAANADQVAANRAWAAAKAQDALANSARRASVALGSSATAGGKSPIGNIADDLTKVGNGFKFTAHEGLNFSRQMADIGVTAAMGMNPLMIALQQGPQLFDIWQQAAIRTGTSIKTAFLASVAAAAPFIAAITAAAAITGALALGIGSVQKQANDNSGLRKFTEEMGYTRSEVEQLNAVTVTFGDTMGAIFEVGMERIANAFGTTTDEIRQNWRSMLGDMLADARQNISEIYGVIVTGFRFLDRGTSGEGAMSFSGMWEEIKADYKEATNDALRFFDETAKNAAARAVTRQNQMARDMQSSSSRGGRSRGKTDAERFQDILETAQNDIATQRTRQQVALLGDNIRAVAELEQRTKLLNDANRRGLTLTAEMRAQIEGLVQEYADLAEAAAIAEAKTSIGDNYDDQVRGLAQARQLIGLYGQDLARATYEQQMLNDAEDAGIKVTGDLTDAQREYVETLKQRAAILAQMDEVNRQRQSLENIRKEADEVAYALGLERDGLHLVNAEAMAYNYAMDKLIEAKRQGITLTDAEVSAIQEAAEAYANQRYEIDRARESIEKSREITKGFFTDWVNKVREGGNIFKTFADSVINSLNRIIDKLMDKMWQNAFAGQSGGGFLGALGSILGGGGGLKLFANGGAFANDNEVMRFAKGGAFTNSIVSRPTLFQYANGGAFGEMGEAGPEAIMPLSRGPDGKLGVEARGGGGNNNNVKVENTYNIGGVMTPEAIIAAIRQGGEETMRAVQRQLPTIMNEYERNGAVAA